MSLSLGFKPNPILKKRNKRVRGPLAEASVRWSESPLNEIQ
jgi:hypothetical protein